MADSKGKVDAVQVVLAGLAGGVPGAAASYAAQGTQLQGAVPPAAATSDDSDDGGIDTATVVTLAGLAALAAAAAAAGYYAVQQ